MYVMLLLRNHSVYQGFHTCTTLTFLSSIHTVHTMALADFMGNPYIPHEIHIFLMEFHEFPMGYS